MSGHRSRHNIVYSWLQGNEITLTFIHIITAVVHFTLIFVFGEFKVAKYSHITCVSFFLQFMYSITSGWAFPRNPIVVQLAIKKAIGYPVCDSHLILISLSTLVDKVMRHSYSECSQRCNFKVSVGVRSIYNSCISWFFRSCLPWSV